MTLFHEAVGHQNCLSCLAFSPNGELLLSGSRDGTAKLWDVKTGQRLRTFWWGSDCIHAVAWSPDGLTVGVAGDPPPQGARSQKDVERLFAFHRGEISNQDLVGQSDEGPTSQLRLYRASDGKLLQVFDDAGCGIAFAADGLSLAALNWDGLLIIDLQSGARRASPVHYNLSEACYSLDGTLVACYFRGYGICVFDARTAALRRFVHDPHLFNAPPDDRPFITLSDLPSDIPDEEVLNHSLRFWSELLPEFRPWSFFDCSREHSIAFSSDGLWAAATPPSRQQWVWNISWENPCQLVLVDLESRSIRAWLRKPNLQSLTTVAFSGDGKLMAWGDWEQNVDLMVVNDRSTTQEFSAAPPALSALSLSPNHRQAAVGTQDGRLLLCDWQQMDVLAVLPVFDQPIEHVEYSPDGKWLLVASREGMVRLLDAMDLKTQGEFQAHRARFLGGSFTADGSQFISLGYADVPYFREAGKPAELIRWSLPDGLRLESLLLPDQFRVNSAAASPDRSQFAFTSREETVVTQIDGSLSYRSVLRQDETGMVTFLPDSARLLVAYEGGSMQILDFKTGSVGKWFSATADGPTSHAFNSTGELLVRSTSYRPMLELFEVATGKYVRQFVGHLNSVNVVAFTPDDARIVSAGRDGTLKFWDAASGELLASIVVFAEPDTTGRQWECLKSLEQDAFR